MVKAFSRITFFFLLILVPFFSEAATLSIVPPTGTFEVGSRAVVKVVAASEAPFNAISGLVSFSTSIFSVESVSKANSILNFWITEPSISKTAGTIKFEGVTLGGFFGASGNVLTINLRALKVGSGTVSFQSGQILANDGEGTNITGNLVGATFSVIEATSRPVREELEPEPATEREEVQPKPTLKAPAISLGSKYGVSSIVGTSEYGKAQVLMTFTARNGTKVFILGAAEDDGSFNLLIPSSLKRGPYTVTAVMIKDDKTNSAESNALTVYIGNIFSDIGWEIQLLIFLLLLTVLYLLLRIHLHYKKDNNIHQVIKSEAQEAESIAHKSFDILREDVLDAENKKLTSAESKRLAGIKKDIDAAEKIITKKIKDIE
jgi:hypothetical protein